MPKQFPKVQQGGYSGVACTVCVFLVGYVWGCARLENGGAPLITNPDVTAVGDAPLPSKVPEYKPAVVRPKPLRLGNVASQRHTAPPAPTGEAVPFSAGSETPGPETSTPAWLKVAMLVVGVWLAVITWTLVGYVKVGVQADD